MPVNSNRHPRLSVGGTTTSNSFGLANTTSFLFDEEDDKHLSLQAIDLKSPVAKAFAQLEGDDTFPTLTSDGLKVCFLSLCGTTRRALQHLLTIFHSCLPTPLL